MALPSRLADRYDAQAKADKVEQRLLEIRVQGTDELERKKADRMIRDVLMIESRIQGQLMGGKNPEKNALVDIYYEQIAELYYSSANASAEELKESTLFKLDFIEQDLNASMGLLSRYEKQPLREFIELTRKKIESRISLMGRLKSGMAAITGNGFLMGAIAGAVTHSPAMFLGVTAFNLLRKTKTGSPKDKLALGMSKQAQQRASAERAGRETQFESRGESVAPRRMPERSTSVPSFESNSPTFGSGGDSFSSGSGALIFAELIKHTKILTNIESLLSQSLLGNKIAGEESSLEASTGTSPIQQVKNAASGKSGSGILGKIMGMFNLRSIFSTMASFLPVLGSGLLTALTPMIPTLLAGAAAAWGLGKIITAGKLAFDMWKESQERNAPGATETDEQKRHMEIATRLAREAGEAAPRNIKEATDITNRHAAKLRGQTPSDGERMTLAQELRPNRVIPSQREADAIIRNEAQKRTGQKFGTSQTTEAMAALRNAPAPPLAAQSLDVYASPSVAAMNSPTRSGDLSQVKGFAGASLDYQQSVLSAASTVGVSPQTLAIMGQLESSSGKHVNAAKGSAKGPFQFIDKTWLDVLGRYGKKYGVDTKNMSQKDILDLRYDNGLSAIMAAHYLRDNAKVLKVDPMDPSNSSKLYLAHFMGPDGAKQVLAGKELKPGHAAEILRYNPSLGKATASNLVSWSQSKISGALVGRGAMPLPVTPTAQPIADLSAGARAQQTMFVSRGNDQLAMTPRPSMLINAPQTNIASGGSRTPQTPIVLPINANNNDGTLERLTHMRRLN